MMTGDAPTGRRLLVCGGRDFTDTARVEWALFHILRELGIACVIEGECPTSNNPDKIARRWAEARGILVHACPVNHETDGRWPAAGPKRNRRMRNLYRPNLGLAFPRANGTWGFGTLGMVRLLDADGVHTWMVSNHIRDEKH